jgi:histidine ammonia-lyase
VSAYPIFPVRKCPHRTVNDDVMFVARDCKAVSGGNFHGEPIAMAMEFLKVAVTELGNIAERRVFQLTETIGSRPRMVRSTRCPAS